MAPKIIPNSLKRAYEDDIVAAQEKYEDHFMRDTTDRT